MSLSIVFLYLLIGIPLTIFFVVWNNHKKEMFQIGLNIISVVLIILITLLPLDYNDKKNYYYPIIGGLFMPEMLSQLFKRIKERLMSLGGHSQNDIEKQKQGKKNSSSVPKKEKKKPVEDNEEFYDNEEEEKEFVVLKDKDIKNRERIKRTTKRTRKINFDE